MYCGNPPSYSTDPFDNQINSLGILPDGAFAFASAYIFPPFDLHKYKKTTHSVLCVAFFIKCIFNDNFLSAYKKIFYDCIILYK
jgi:hypothetical protein